jgi:hypothetical protein
MRAVVTGTDHTSADHLQRRCDLRRSTCVVGIPQHAAASLGHGEEILHIHSKIVDNERSVAKDSRPDSGQDALSVLARG